MLLQLFLIQSCGPKEVPSPGVSGSKGSVCQGLGEADRNLFFFCLFNVWLEFV